jgi:hypothetical protein
MLLMMTRDNHNLSRADRASERASDTSTQKKARTRSSSFARRSSSSPLRLSFQHHSATFIEVKRLSPIGLCGRCWSDTPISSILPSKRADEVEIQDWRLLPSSLSRRSFHRISSMFHQSDRLFIPVLVSLINIPLPATPITYGLLYWWKQMKMWC